MRKTSGFRGNPTLFVYGITQDVTDRKRWERELTESRKELEATLVNLEQLVSERTRELEHAYADTVKYGAYKLDERAVKAGERRPSGSEVATLAARILELIDKKPLYYAEVIEAFPEASLQAITRAFGKLHADEKLWQDPEGRMCVRGSKFAAVLRTA